MQHAPQSTIPCNMGPGSRLVQHKLF